ncbi:MAG: S1C family serine protease [Candidatus Nanosyncoccaceae bacterium]|jgi:serine protease Do
MDPEVGKKSNNKATIVALVIFGLVAILSIVVYFSGWLDNKSDQLVTDRSKINISGSGDKNSYQFAEQKISISDVVDKVSPSVVSILTTTNSMTFWGESSVQQGAGSGIILSKDGYILTNKHVVSGAKAVVVALANGETYDDVEILFLDPMNDLAFLKINNVNNLTPIEIGDSKTIKVGQPVLAIGNALGEYQNTVTDGIISGVGRNIVAQGGNGYGAVKSEGLSDLIQTNAAINSGNSGGPLVNAGGQLIGINTAVAQNAHGIGFAIPVGAAKGVIKQLGRDDSNIRRGYIGVSYMEITPTVAKQRNLARSRGAIISQNGVMSGSPAKAAGLREGDIITKVNDSDIGVVGSVATLVAEYSPGEIVELIILRDGSEQAIKVEVGQYTD